MAMVSPVLAELMKPLVAMILPMPVDPFIPMVLPVPGNPFGAMVEFVTRAMMWFDLVMARPMMEPAIVMYGLNPLFRPMFTIPFSPSISPGNSGEYKHQPNNHHTDFQ